MIWGLLLQWIFGLLVLRWSVGMKAVSFFANQVVTFLAFADEGSRFVFGNETYTDHPFAFQVSYCHEHVYTTFNTILDISSGHSGNLQS